MMNAAEFKQRFLPLGRRLYRVAWNLTGNAQDAEDLVQDTYCRLWRKRDELGMVVSDEAYCVSMVKNLYHDTRRAAASRDVDIGPPDALPLMADDDVQRDVERAEAALTLRRIIATLPEGQRVAITRRDLEDAEFAEIARSMGISEGSVRVLLSRARRKVKEQFKNWMKHDNQAD